MAQVSIFVFGLQGVGKSSCGRAFLQKNDVFEVSSSPKPCTSGLKIGQNMVNGAMRRFVDIPGLDSTEEDNSPIMIDMVRSLNSKNIGINAFFLVISIKNSNEAKNSPKNLTHQKNDSPTLEPNNT